MKNLDSHYGDDRHIFIKYNNNKMVYLIQYLLLVYNIYYEILSIHFHNTVF